MNECLLLKCWWRYGCESNALWRKVIDAKYGGSITSWGPNGEPSVTKSKMWSDILLVMDRDAEVANFYDENKSLKAGNGRKVSFWYDT